MIPKRSVVVLVVAAACFVALTMFKVRQSPLGQGILLLLTPIYIACLMVSAAEPLRAWRSHKLLTVVPLLACAAASYGSYPAGAFLQARVFTHNLPRFEAIVDGIQKEALPLNGESRAIEISKEDRGEIQQVFAHYAADKSLIVEIDTGNGFPAKHSGYVYSSSGLFPEDARFHYRWPYVEEVRPRWFRVSN